ncbi:MAG: ABC transporter ATP-binding protein [Gloeomargaritaceae cyanobacterium C42_A2020_066]|nr:ABC transporter ATP-binding protein [Gloeomargaritaceae cyanobacterium C42_A2020_066]
MLTLDNLGKRYAGQGQPALSGVSLSLPAGDILGLLGPSGCGKTTLLRLVAGFEQPDTGQVWVAGRPVASDDHWLPPEQRPVGMVFQDYALFPHLTVAENIAFGLQHRQGLSRAAGRGRVAEVLDLVGLSAYADRYPHALSGGEQQRVALARALAPQPALILLDEPLSHLDAQVRLRLRHEVRRILKETGISGVFVTHDQEEALSISDWIGVICQGKLEQFGRPEAIYRTPASRFVAEFVTQANFLPAQSLGSQAWQTDLGLLTLPLAGAAGDLMIPQESLSLEPDESSPVVIQDCQFLGRERRYCLRTPAGREVHARVNQTPQLAVGTHVRVRVDADQVRLFETRPADPQFSFSINSVTGSKPAGNRVDAV